MQRFLLVVARVTEKLVRNSSHAIDSKILQIIELADDSGNIPHSIPIAVLVGTRVDLVDDSI